MNVTMPNRAVTDRFGSLSHLDEAPKATFPSVLLRQRGAIGVMRIDRACNISMRRERIEFFQIPSRMAIRGRARPIEDIVEKGAIQNCGRHRMIGFQCFCPQTLPVPVSLTDTSNPA